MYAIRSYYGISDEAYGDIAKLINARAFGYGEYATKTRGTKEEKFFIVMPLEALDWFMVVDFPKSNMVENFRLIVTIVSIFSLVWGILIWFAGYYLLNKEIA